MADRSSEPDQTEVTTTPHTLRSVGRILLLVVGIVLILLGVQVLATYFQSTLQGFSTTQQESITNADFIGLMFFSWITLWLLGSLAIIGASGKYRKRVTFTVLPISVLLLIAMIISYIVGAHP